MIDSVDICTEALAIADRGMFVFPVKGATATGPEMKAPAAEAGRWSQTATRDTQTIISWFAARPDFGIGVACGPSGLVVVDIDTEDVLPEDWLTPTLTSATSAGRRHLIYAAPDGAVITNSLGSLPAGFGDIRGAGGYFIAPPSPHPDGHRYKWVDIQAEIAELPEEIVLRLPSRAKSPEGAASKVEVASFLERHVGGRRRSSLKGVKTWCENRVAQGASRHNTALSGLAWAMSEAARKYYPANEAAAEIHEWFVGAIDGARPVDGEWERMLCWGVGQVVEPEQQLTATIDDALEALGDYLVITDPQLVEIVLAAAVSAVGKAEPLWPVIVGAPSSGKTELIRTLSLLADVSISDVSGPAALLAFSKAGAKEKAQPSGILAGLNDRYDALATIADLSPLLAGSDNTRNSAPTESVMALLRDVYDGACHRDIGQQGRASWRGRLTLIGAATPRIDSLRNVNQALGERFLYVRLRDFTDEQARATADKQVNLEAEALVLYRAQAAETIADLVETARQRLPGITLDEETKAAITLSAELGARARSDVERDRFEKGRPITSTPSIEGPPRMTRQLQILATAHQALELPSHRTPSAVARAALDSIPPARAEVLRILSSGEALSARAIQRESALSDYATRRALADLEALGLTARHGDWAEDQDDQSDGRPWTLNSRRASRVVQWIALIDGPKHQQMRQAAIAA